MKSKRPSINKPFREDMAATYLSPNILSLAKLKSDERRRRIEEMKSSFQAVLAYFKVQAQKMGIYLDIRAIGQAKGQINTVVKFFEECGRDPRETIRSIVENWLRITRSIRDTGRCLRPDPKIIHLGFLCRYRANVMAALDEVLEQDEP